MSKYLGHIVLLPGFGASNREYQQYRATFPNITVVDFSNSTTLEDHVGAISKQTRDLGKFILVGVSWGAVVSLFYAKHHPSRVRGLILGGAGRKIHLPVSLKTVLSLPYCLFSVTTILFILSFPFFYIFDRKGYRQKYGGLGVLYRLGWKQTHEIFNNSIRDTYFDGSIHHDTIFINLKSDYLVDTQEIDDLIETADDNNVVRAKYLTPPDESHIHFTHELDSLIIEEIAEFIAKLETRSEKIYA